MGASKTRYRSVEKIFLRWELTSLLLLTLLTSELFEKTRYDP